MKKLFLFFCFFYLNCSFAQDYSVYALSQDFPMGEKDEVINKNFYITIGKEQGVYPGAILDVFRTIFVINGSNPMQKINHQVKIGELKVIHSENKASIAVLQSKISENQWVVLDFKGIKIGDLVAPKIGSK